jgi:hypothetical protein
MSVLSLGVLKEVGEPGCGDSIISQPEVGLLRAKWKEVPVTD